MKLLSVVGARVGILLPWQDIAPLKGLYLPDVASAIIERYAFAQEPKFDPDTISKLGVAFGMGKFSAVGEERNIRTLHLYNDGIIADCYSTEEASLLVQDLLKWASEKFETRVSSIPEGRLNLVSVLLVEFPESVATAFNRFTDVLALARQTYHATYGVERDMTVTAFNFSIDPSTVSGPMAQAPGFAIERELNQPYSLNRYWSQAPVHTQDHIRILEKFELITTA